MVCFYQKLFAWIGKQTDFRGILSCHLDATFKKNTHSQYQATPMNVKS